MSPGPGPPISIPASPNSSRTSFSALPAAWEGAAAGGGGGATTGLSDDGGGGGSAMAMNPSRTDGPRGQGGRDRAQRGEAETAPVQAGGEARVGAGSAVPARPKCRNQRTCERERPRIVRARCGGSRAARQVSSTMRRDGRVVDVADLRGTGGARFGSSSPPRYQVRRRLSRAKSTAVSTWCAVHSRSMRRGAGRPGRGTAASSTQWAS